MGSQDRVLARLPSSIQHKAPGQAQTNAWGFGGILEHKPRQTESGAQN